MVHTIYITFDDKAFKLIRISQILNHKDVTKTFPSNLQTGDTIPMVKYHFGDTIKNKVLIYKETVNLILDDENFRLAYTRIPANSKTLSLVIHNVSI